MPRAPRSEAQQEILDAIRFYERHGLDWTDVVAFLACKATGAEFWKRPKAR